MSPQTLQEQSAVVMQLRALATVARGLDGAELERFVESREHAMAIGPILQPTSWLEHGFNADRAFVDLARAAVAFRQAVAEAAELLER